MMQVFVSLAPYALLAVNTVLLLALFLGINQRFRNLRRQFHKGEAARDNEAARFSKTIDDLRNRIATFEKEEKSNAVTEAAASGLNSTLRGKVLKMHRLGQPSDRIAEVLRVPRGEVDLLVKVHAIVMRTYQGVAQDVSQGGTLDLPEAVKKG